MTAETGSGTGPVSASSLTGPVDAVPPGTASVAAPASVPAETRRTGASPAVAPPGAGDVLGDHYRLEARIGHGGSADVWRGRDLRLDRTVAVKVFRPGAAVSGSRDAAEAQTRATVNDPAAVAVLDVSSGGDERYVVTELVEGDDLGSLIARGPMAPDLARRVAADVAGALAALHARGLAHGGVKPPAILVLRGAEERDGLAAKLNDVGVAPASAAPGADGRRLGPADDVRALGLVLLASLLGGRAFRRAVELSGSGVPAPGADLSPDAADLLRRMTDRDPGARPGAIEVGRALRHDLVGRMTRVEAGSTAPVAMVAGSPTGGGTWTGVIGTGTAPIPAAPALFGPPTGGVPLTEAVAVQAGGRRRVPLVAVFATTAIGAVVVAGTAVGLALTVPAPAAGRPAIASTAAISAPASAASAGSSDVPVVPVVPGASRASASAAPPVPIPTASSAPRPTRIKPSATASAPSAAPASAAASASASAPVASAPIAPSASTATDGTTGTSSATPTPGAG